MNILKSKKYTDNLQKTQIQTKHTCKVLKHNYIPVAFEF